MCDKCKFREMEQKARKSAQERILCQRRTLDSDNATVKQLEEHTHISDRFKKTIVDMEAKGVLDIWLGILYIWLFMGLGLAVALLDWSWLKVILLE